ncbi:helix-turn-helix domain-containing protein [Candidatus Woesearchaeota archaeon]|nr:helix-turn-helix domain-containing protein [Candidatus Woesearchaeota archaeon]
MDSIKLMEKLFDTKIIKILKLFINNESEKYYLREIAKLTETSPASTYRILNKLVELKIISLHKNKTSKLYTLESNKNTDFFKTILRTEKHAIDLFIQKAKKIEEIKTILIHGRQDSKRANLLLIGENIPQGDVKRITADIKEKYDFTITTLQLQREQFEQMSAMGLYSGKKKVLFNR